jgi:hypothetical protein
MTGWRKNGGRGLTLRQVRHVSRLKPFALHLGSRWHQVAVLAGKVNVRCSDSTVIDGEAREVKPEQKKIEFKDVN